ncbi:MAG: alpha-amylase family glycosyl hydrolase [Fidelibacterota bacterium]
MKDRQILTLRMKTKGIIVLVCGLFFQTINAQVVYSDPFYAMEGDSITVYFDATEGDQGLMGFSGDIWAHTGVITTNSTSPGDWKYVKTNWGENTDDTQLTPLGNDLWKLDIGFPHTYYGVPNGEQILQLAFVFRNHDGSQTGRDIGGADIFLDLYDPGVTAIVVSPFVDFSFRDPRRAPVFGFPADTIPVSITGAAINTEISDLLLLVDDSLHSQSSSDTLITDLILQNFSFGMHELIAVALDTAGLTDSSQFYIMVHNEPIESQRPTGTEDGITYIDAGIGTVQLSLFAPYKEFIYVIGDFNDWAVDEDYYMQKDVGSPDSVHFWITLDNLIPGQEYAFQYLVDGEIRIADPYTDKILDKWNDPWIPNITYPNLKEYPLGKTDHIVSVLQTNQLPFNWQYSDSFERPPKEELIIYELLIRDFVSRHDYQTLIDTLDYLENLGINAIEIMPFNEFEGNSSWGYNPSFYFAPDKYYGPKNALKAFVDECHHRGIAVVMDIVLNHTYGQSPFVRLYNVEEWGPPTPQNPWYNTQSNFTNPDAQWGNDFNHESIHTQKLVDRINRYWMDEYKIDGFRFDFTKGFGNNIKGSNDPWGSNYDADRIRILKRMADEIWEADSTAYVILEHLAVNSEEKELADYGMLLWGNTNYNYAEAAMGYNSNSDFSWGYYGTRGWNNPHLVTYFESHDEERLMYKNLTWGDSSGDYDVTQLSTALNRMKAVGAFFFTIPGPKMLWQFGELGYDVSIDDPCRICEKPILWNYYNNTNRSRLYKVYQALIKLRKENAVFHSADTDVSLSVSSSTGKKRIRLSHSDMNAVIIGNFGVINQSIPPQFHHAGMWYDYFSGDSLSVQNVGDQISLFPGEFHIYTDSYIEPPEQGILSNIKEEGLVPQEFSLNQNYPNPFNPTTTIQFSVESLQETSLQIFDVTGRLVSTLINESLDPGNYSIQWKSFSNSSGVYFVRLTSGSKTKTIKMILVK